MTDILPDPERPGLDPLEEPPPRFAEDEAERIAADHFGVIGSASPLNSERDQNVRITSAGGDGYVLKISNPAEEPAFVDLQTQAMLHVAATDPRLPVMRLIKATKGTNHVDVIADDGRSHIVRLVTLMPGRALEAGDLDHDALWHFGVVSARLGRALQGFFHTAAGHPLQWNVKYAPALRPLLDHVQDPVRRATVERVLDRFEAHVRPAFASLRGQVIHNDLTTDNVLFDTDLRVSGILDFGDMAYSALVCDLVSTAEALMGERSDPFDTLRETAAGFISVTPLQDDEIAVLPDLLLARWATTAVISAWRVRSYPENADYITGWDEGVWAMLGSWEAMGHEAFAARVREAIHAASGSGPHVSAPGSLDAMIERRRAVLGSAISPLSYDRPLHLVEGRGAWVFDSDGGAYVDAYNNVPVVGHCHPRVVDAIARQAAALNTNTRYLHDSVLELAERLIATMPEGLDTVMFVNSGSEANDLAWRLATTVTGERGCVVTDFAYHGVTAAVADLSPEEWGETDRPDHIATIPPPDGYRGRFRREEPDWATRYAGCVGDAIETLAGRGFGPAVLMIDGGFTSDGVFEPPPDYMQEAVRAWQDAGGVFVADEVQVGFGRSGTYLWGFQAYGVTPDIVTLGKPMGNGHPVAAVVTRSDIVDRFARTTEWFSTFGGNPVACEAGLAVLDVIEAEDLIARAGERSAELVSALGEVAGRHDLIGDVRSVGLLLGVELVLGRTTREPATEEATRAVNAMRDRGVLVGTTGREGNVLKIRPPLVIEASDAARIVETLDAVLSDRG
jgi:4-aminobutyrate aminotransferase-like enzyme/Ser/Thr protein kinase RdoA (MazF antagonist)